MLDNNTNIRHASCEDRRSDRERQWGNLKSEMKTISINNQSMVKTNKIISNLDRMRSASVESPKNRISNEKS